MPQPLTALLSTRNPLILDGALATYLETLGADISTSLWSASLLSTNPSLIQRTHLDYFRAGANIAITASYQASIPGLCSHLNISEEEAKGLVVQSVELARRAREEYMSELGPGTTNEQKAARRESLLIAGSVGPYGAYLADGSEYTGSYSPCPTHETFKTFHRPRIAALLSTSPFPSNTSPSPSPSGVDILALETLPSYPETQALASLLSTEFPGRPCWFSFTLRDASHISDGTPLSTVVSLLDSQEHENRNLNVVAIGVNCISADLALPALQTLKSLTRKPLIVYPNSGEEWDAAGRGWRGERTQGAVLAERARTWYEAGARIIGGCCRTTPDDIQVIAETFRDAKQI
ncbi:homocysteine methyltransferase [Lophiostoma macrostomum CBS 122681]|uniref:Homocysteine methyltransferase n=1 Tax=Lophiostoma macrostomum CBS 122681 TaxID=1314788 RepID=A0A6A6TCP7_9PLEO|nr:homocysteine methyltransferase [Lophiostoma macrostomum CBS 122681]